MEELSQEHLAIALQSIDYVIQCRQDMLLEVPTELVEAREAIKEHIRYITIKEFHKVLDEAFDKWGGK